MSHELLKMYIHCTIVYAVVVPGQDVVPTSAAQDVVSAAVTQDEAGPPPVARNVF